MKQTYVGITDMEVIERTITLLKKKEVVTVKLTRVLGGHIGSGIWDMEIEDDPIVSDTLTYKTNCTSPHDSDRDCEYKSSDECILVGECNWKEITPRKSKGEWMK